jgi:formylmethanofuran dehydrogenase subunit E
MARILILIILGWILYQIVKRLIANTTPETTSKPEENFVQCVRCGCHVPTSESKMLDNKIICNNPECQNQHGN